MKISVRLLALVLAVFSQVGPKVRAQTLDPSFAAIDLRRPAVINDALQQPDGKIVTVGSFTQVGSKAANNLARLNADGTLDEAFTTAAANPSFIERVRQYPNGQLLVLGYSLQVGGRTFLTAARLNADGTLDTSFNVGNGSAASIASAVIQPDGKVLLSGQFSAFNGIASNGLVRLNADGSVDRAFLTALGTGFTTSGRPASLSLALQPDGKIVVGGRFDSYQGTGRANLVRLNADGSLDTTFNPALATDAANFGVFAVALDPRTNYVVLYNVSSGTSNYLLRLTTTGAVDATFQSTLYLTCTEQGTVSDKLAVDASGRVLFTGCFYSSSYAGNYTSGNSLLLRLLPSGAIDTQFAVQQQLDSRLYFVRPLADGTALIGGTFGRYGTTRNVNLLRLSATAQVVSSFVPALTEPGYLASMAVQPDGKVLVAGRFSQLNGSPANNVARLTTTGTIDPAFSLGGTDGAVQQLLLQASGKIMLTGGFNVAGARTSPYVARLLADGTGDASFTTTGAASRYSSLPGPNALSEQPDGSFIVVSPAMNFSGLEGTLHRLSAAGVADATYAQNLGTGTSSELYSVASLPTGQHYVGGYFSTFGGRTANNVVRLNANGTFDTSFSAVGQGLPPYVRKLVPLPSGQLLLAGQGSGSDYSLQRLSATGVRENIPVITGGIRDIARYANGRILLAGGAIVAGGAVGGLVRLNPDLTYDTSFANAFPGYSYFGPSVLALQADNAILVAGAFSQVGSASRSFMARLNAPNVLAVAPQQRAAEATAAWPNPAHGQLQLALDATAQPRTVTLLDVTGRVVLTQAASQPRLTLDVLALPTGTYLLQVDYATGPVTRRVVLD